MFNLIPLNTRYDFVGKRRIWLTISALALLGGLISMFVQGWNFSVDFKGGTDVQVKFRGDRVTTEQIRAAMRTAKYENAAASTFGDETNSFLIRLPQISFLSPKAITGIKDTLTEKFGKKGTDGKKALFRREGGFLLEGGRVELSLTQAVSVKDLEKVFIEKKIPLRRGVEVVDEVKNEYVVRFKLGDMNKEQFQQALNKFRGSFAGSLAKDDIALRKDRATLRFSKAMESVAIEAALEKAGFDVADPVEILRKERNEYIIHMVGLAAKIREDLNGAFPKNKIFVERVDSVGAKVGAQLRQDAIASLLYAIIGILIYVAFRFDFVFAPGAVIALIHDALIVVGFFSVTQMEFSLGTVAAVLTVIGYSVNDTIVVYDRVRENSAKYRDWPLGDVLNTSINETLSRTVLTTLTTLITVLAMLFLGGGLVREFAIALLVGNLSGVYSTIFIASPVTLIMEKLMERAKARRMVAAAR